MEPTEAWHAGDLRAGSSRPREENAWILRMPPRLALEFEDLLQELLMELEPRTSELLDLTKESGVSVRLSCFGYTRAVLPALYFEHDLLNRICALGVDLDIDIIHQTSPTESGGS
jgi:hypothetical protein